MNWQLATVLALVGLAGIYLSCRSWRAWKKAARGCSGGCGCPSSANTGANDTSKSILISRDSLKLRTDRSSDQNLAPISKKDRN